jgi:hypothetical protein
MVILSILLAAGSQSLFGQDVGVRIVPGKGELVQELLAKTASGKFEPILLSPTHPDVHSAEQAQEATAISAPSRGLFSNAPTFLFRSARVDETHRTMTLIGGDDRATVEEILTVPEKGSQIDVHLHVHLRGTTPQIERVLASYAFAPGKPDTTWAPGLRGRSELVIGDHFFRSPAVVAQKGSLSAALIPDLDVLSKNRPIPTIIDLNCAGDICDKPLLSYGFCDHRLVAHVAYAHDAGSTRPVPPDLNLAFQIRLDGSTAPSSAYEAVADSMWNRYGHRYLDKILPQAMPFADYASYCYPASFAEKQTGGWFERTIDGHVCGGLPSGWGLDQGWVSWQSWFCQIRSAWGIRWWGKKLGKSEWVDKSDKMLNLALAAPMHDGACPTTYESRTGEWKGSLITPSDACYYDLTNIAWKGIWLLRWYGLPDCPRKADVANQVTAIAHMLLTHQSSDGSFPSWLDRDLKPVPILDRSAQSALPVWFLAEYAKAFPRDSADRVALLRGADFLANEVVDPQRYYDFETFFSCSPKTCLQRDYKLDDAAMMDPYTLQRPQNTLSMQWTAEALRAAAHVDPKNPRYMTQALKALDMMCLYQEVWPISYFKTAYVYGGFGVQNSDGEYDDARQAQFAETLCDFGAELGRQDLFERGVAAARSTLALINHPLHAELGIYPNPNYPPGLEPENCGHGGTDEQDGRSGFDWAEGSGLATMARLLDRYGSSWTSSKGWTVVIDGVPAGSHLTPQTEPPLKDPTFDFSNWRAEGWTFDGSIIAWPLLANRMDFGNHGVPFIGTGEDGRGAYNDELTGTATSPRFTTSHKKIRLLVGGGDGDGEYVELIDDSGKQLAVEHGHKSEHMDERVWDISPYPGIPLRIRIVDRETGGWGHINVGDIRLTD